MSNQTALHQLVGRGGPTLGFGLMPMSYASYGSVPGDEERFAILDRALELGSTFWDSSDLYGDNEELIGKWFRRTGKRDDIFLATKFGFVKGSKTMEVDSSGEFCKKACYESLRLLGIECIDLYYMHHSDHKTPIEETMRALLELQRAGKIKHIGLSSVSSATLRRATKIGRVAAVQVDYSAFVRDIEGPSGTDLLATCRELGVTTVAAMPLGRGMITSRFAQGQSLGDDADRRPSVMPRFMGDNRDKNAKVMEQFNALAQKKGCTAPQLAIAWLLKQGHDIIPIPGTKQLKYLEENWASLKVNMTDQDEAEVRRFLEGAEIAGKAIPAAFESFYFSDTVEEA